MADLKLHPSGILHLTVDDPGATQEPDLSAGIRKLVAADWRTGLISLAGSVPATDESSLAARFWRNVAAHYLTRLCHRPNPSDLGPLPFPDQDELQRWVDTAPPIPGGEYLRTEVLAGIWDHLNRWLAEAAGDTPDIESLLERWAPGWNRVGRVTFHLAENKSGAALPFAFMATFTSGLGAGGREKHLPLAQALELYSGRNQRNALVKLLTPVQRAARSLDWVADLVESGRIYRPSAWTAKQAHRFLHSMPELDEAGIVLRIPDWWSRRARARVEARIDTRQASLLDARSLLSIDVQVMLGDHRLSPSELEQLMSDSDGLVLIKGQWVEVDRERLRHVLDYWNGVADEAVQSGLSLHEGMRLLAGAAADLGSGPRPDPEWSEVIAGKNLQDTLVRLRDPATSPSVRMKAKLRDTLRPYQHVGVSWLALTTELGLGACLADDMGLGKTLQVLALLSSRAGRRKKGPSLLVAPASLLGNWRAEAERFTPDLKVLVLHPSHIGRAELDGIAAGSGTSLDRYDLVVTTYALAHRMEWLADRAWHLLILDEAQAIKNHGTRQSRAVRRLRADARIALTGTPVENRLDDLWSLFDFLNPGLLGSAKVFKNFLKRLDTGGYEPLRRLVAPYILRRLKTDRSIIADLPDKTETIRYCNLTPTQVRLYRKIVNDLERGLEKVGQGIERRGVVLQTLTRLKQVCNHPDQLTGDVEYDPRHSGKFARLEEICSELRQRQQKVLVFTQYKEIIPHLEEHLARIFGRAGLTLHGGTAVRKRSGLVERFQRVDGPPFFVLSLKAGGTGLNLTEACHVIHFDRWWNPAVENQATDRAFRIGQKQNVLVHKFVTTGTVEEKIDRMIDEKRALSEQVLAGDGIRLTEMTDQQLMDIVRLDVHAMRT